jgi:4-amino-4-deoxy-L-arabinose transferase-like glycosyltransferase
MTPKTASRLHIAGVLAAAALLLLPGLGSTDLWAPDEPRYAQVAEELRSMEHGLPGLAVLHLGGEVYTQKPPLYYWLAAGLGAAGGGRVSELQARLPSALAGIASVLVTVVLGRMLFGRLAAGLWSGVLLLSAYRFAHTARRAQLDVLLTLCETLALLAFWRLEQRRGSQRANLLLLHGATGLALLTKGPVGLLPIAVMAAFLAWERRLPELRKLLPAWGLMLSLGPALAWIVAAVALAPPGFFDHAVVANLFGRFFSGTAHVRPFYYFLIQLPIDFMPWTLLWPLVVPMLLRSSESPPQRPVNRFLLSWAGVMLVFFSLSAGKRGLYLLPAFPALALLCGGALQRALEPPSGALAPWVTRALGLAAGALAVAGGALAVGGSWTLEAFPGFALPSELGLALAGTGILALGAWLLLGRRGAPLASRVAVVVASCAAIELAVFTLVYPAYDVEKSPRPIVEATNRLAAPDEPVGVFDHRALAGGILYYGRRQVVDLPTPESVERFFRDGGRAVILKAYKLPWLEQVGPLEVRARIRSGRREVIVVTPAGPA